MPFITAYRIQMSFSPKMHQSRRVGQKPHQRLTAKEREIRCCFEANIDLAGLFAVHLSSQPTCKHQLIKICLRFADPPLPPPHPIQAVPHLGPELSKALGVLSFCFRH